MDFWYKNVHFWCDFREIALTGITCANAMMRRITVSDRGITTIYTVFLSEWIVRTEDETQSGAFSNKQHRQHIICNKVVTYITPDGSGTITNIYVRAA